MTTCDNPAPESLSLAAAEKCIRDLRARQAELETRLKELQTALKGSAEREAQVKLHAIIQGSPIPAFAIDADHTIIHWNKALAKLSGIRAERVVGTNQQWRAFYSQKRPCLADLLVDQAQAVITDWYAGKFIESDLIPDAYEVTDFFPDLGENGKWLRFTASAVRDEQGTVVGAFETLEDVSDRKQAEEWLRSKTLAQRKLAEANLRIESILNTVTDGFWEADFSAKMFQFSRRMFAMLGYAPMDGAEGFGFLSDKVHPEDRKAVDKDLEELAEGAISHWETSYRMQAADGSWRHILSRGNCVGRDEQGRGCRFAGTHTDITEQRRTEAALADMAAELRETREKMQALQLSGK